MDTIRFAVGAAVHAPSVQNTQPWRFGHGDRDIDVYADAGRRLRVADPDGREMMISCGAAVFTLRLALRYRGWLPRTRLFPDPSQPGLVARVSWDDDRIDAAGYEREMATSANEPADWVTAGQALQRILLRAATFGVAAALHSQPLGGAAAALIIVPVRLASRP